MRNVISINDNWSFTKNVKTETVNLPHTFNNVDGQAGADYFRGECVYERVLPETEGVTYIEFCGANSVAKVYVNGNFCGEHRGGYSMFRFNITEFISGKNDKVTVKVDNSDFQDVYPSMADFTFYGGLYRDVNIITGLKKTHISLNHGFSGFYALPEVADGDGKIKIKAFLDGDVQSSDIKFSLISADGRLITETVNRAARENNVVMAVTKPELWNGMDNPYLYTLKASIIEDGAVIDETDTRIGFRTIVFDSEKGCILNGKRIKLKGVSRHQDRLGLGNALTVKEHKEDIALIKEVGANSIRLAHYQQDKKFYDLCDEEGFLVWAEVPVISRFSVKKQENAESQLTELITQNVNHPSIYCWGIQNELTISGKAKGLEEGIRRLNDLAHKLDPSRPTTSAQVMMCGMDSVMNKITDILGYNHYFGWYYGMYDAIDGWLDEFHTKNPEIKLCLSEYGAEAILKYQSERGVQGDYTEAYQARFHLHYAKAIMDRDWLFGGYVWNMFDFCAANRDEGGVKARNNKGLISFDRKIKKDAFYVYKAFWSDDKFVHIGGERYKDRPIGNTSVTVYSNLPEIKLEVNGESYVQKCDKCTVFENIRVEPGDFTVKATAGDIEHTITLTGTDKENPDYVMPESVGTMVRNWFNDDSGGSDKDGFYNIDDRVKDLLKSPDVMKLLKGFMGNKVKPYMLFFLKPFKVRTLLKIARMDDNVSVLANQYLQTLRRVK